MGRTAAELRAAAIATGTFNDYVGDGASVPWECSPPPYGVLLYAYKEYLDSRWWEAFRLHDWLYTPYGQLINADRLESDEALAEEIGRDSIADAEIVFNAVRLGGAPYFGVSQTGYYPTPPALGRGNIAKTPRSIQGAAAMPIKVVMLFQNVTIAGNNAPPIGYAGREHMGGWSEHVWYNSDNVAQCIQQLKEGFVVNEPGLLPSRAIFLPTNTRILGARLYLGGSGRAQFLPAAYPGTWASPDIPQMAALVKAQAADGVSRTFTLRGIPDSQVEGGELKPTPLFVQQMRVYFGALRPFSFRALNTGIPILAVVNVTAAGLVTLTGANPYAIGALVTFNRLNTESGGQVSETAMVTAIGPLANQFTVGNTANPWPLPATTGGTVTQKVYSLHSLDGATVAVSRITTRRVGRPSELYRGRASKRR